MKIAGNRTRFLEASRDEQDGQYSVLYRSAPDGERYRRNCAAQRHDSDFARRRRQNQRCTRRGRTLFGSRPASLWFDDGIGRRCRHAARHGGPDRLSVTRTASPCRRGWAGTAARSRQGDDGGSHRWYGGRRLRRIAPGFYWSRRRTECGLSSGGSFARFDRRCRSCAFGAYGARIAGGRRCGARWRDHAGAGRPLESQSEPSADRAEGWPCPRGRQQPVGRQGLPLHRGYRAAL